MAAGMWREDDVSVFSLAGCRAFRTWAKRSFFTCSMSRSSALSKIVATSPSGSDAGAGSPDDCYPSRDGTRRVIAANPPCEATNNEFRNGPQCNGECPGGTTACALRARGTTSLTESTTSTAARPRHGRDASSPIRQGHGMRLQFGRCALSRRRDDAQDLVPVGRAAAAAVAVAGGDVERLVGSHHHVAQPAGLVAEIHLVQLDGGGVLVAELHTVEVLGAQGPDQQASSPLRNGAAGVERRAARRDRLLPGQRGRHHAGQGLATVDARPAEVRSG